jgi:hypothetical protein
LPPPLLFIPHGRRSSHAPLPSVLAAAKTFDALVQAAKKLVAFTSGKGMEF